ncbi:MAG: ADP-ribosylglycohydrolase family protein [Planctomycetota bacterium]|nr:MAG: ADP-ribosylglycohydrolase family protein [Planctomycetota bacterium]
MIGAITGDVIGSVFEFHSTKSKDFELFSERSSFTDDSLLTIAVADCLLTGRDYVDAFHEAVAEHPRRGWGGNFRRWARRRDTEPYNSWGNGSAMRVSAVGWAFDDAEQVLREAERSAAATHNHPEGIKGAQATALAVLRARMGVEKHALRDELTERFGYELTRTLDAIRPDYQFDVSCQGSVPESLICVFEADDFEDAIRNAVSLGGDADTMAAIAGAVAEPLFGGVPEALSQPALSRLTPELLATVEAFVERFGGS